MADVSKILADAARRFLSSDDKSEGAGVRAAQARGASPEEVGYARAAEDSRRTGQSANRRINYGDISGDPLQLAAEEMGRSQYVGDLIDARTGGQRFRDAAVGAGEAAVTGLNNLANLGTQGLEALGVVKEGTAVQDAVAIQESSDWMKSFQTQSLENNRRAQEARDADSRARTEERYGRERRTGESDLVATLRREGAQAINKISNMDGSNVTDLLSQGAGSLATGGIAGRALRRATAGRLGMPTVVAGMEAGGGYVDTANQVMQMSDADLMAGSADYAQLRRTMSEDEAKREIAGRAAGVTRNIMAGVGAATGLIGQRFELNPFKAGSVRAGLTNVTKEAVEEGLQEGSASVAGNLGIRAYADRDRRLTQGLGEGVATGMVAGAGIAGITQAPATTWNAGKATVGWTARKVRDQVAKRIDGITGRVNAASPVSTENVGQEFQAATEAVLDPQVRADVEAAAVETTGSPQQAQAVVDYYDELSRRMSLDPAEADAEPSPLIADTMRQSSDRFDMIRRMAGIAGEVGRDVGERVEAGMYLFNIQNRDAALLESLEKAVTLGDKKDPRYAGLNQLERTVLDLGQMPEVVKAVQLAVAEASNIQPTQITPGSAAVRATVAAAKMAPGNINPETARAVLSQAKAKAIELSEEERAAVEVAAKVADAVIEYRARADRFDFGDESPADMVARAIISDRIQRGPGETDLSASEHLQRVSSAMAAGNVEAARDYLNDFMMFAVHMSNKTEAFNKSLDTGKPVYSQSLTIKRAWAQSVRPWITHVNSTKPGKAESSIRFHQRVATETAAIAAMANTLAERFPELGVSTFTPERLDARLEGKAADVAAKFAAAKKAGQKIAKVEKPVELKAPPKIDPLPTVTEAEPAQPAQEKPVSQARPAEPAQISPTPEPKAEAKVEQPVPAKAKPEPKQEAEPAPVKVEAVKTPTPNSQGGRIAKEFVATPVAERSFFLNLYQQLAGLGRQDKIDFLEQGEGFVDVKPVSAELRSKIDEALSAISEKLGVDVSGIVSDYFTMAADGTVLAMYSPTANSIVLSQRLLDRLPKESADWLTRIIAHELGHAFDFFASEESAETKMLDRHPNPENPALIERYGLEGPLWQEFVKLKGKVPEWAWSPDFRYIESNLNDKNDPYNDNFKSEFFAELVMFSTMEPDLAQELIPNGYALVQEVVRELAQANGVTPESEPAADRGDAGPVEADSTPAEEVTEPVPAPVAPDGEPFADLAQDPKTGNFFLKTFTIEKGASRLSGLGNRIYDTVQTALSSTAAFVQFAGEKALGSQSISPDVSKAFAEMVSLAGDISEKMDARLNKLLDEPIAKGAPTIREGLTSGATQRSVNDIPKAKILSLVDNVDGKVSFNEQLRQAAVLAGINWALTQANGESNLDDEKLLKLLGADTEADLDEEVDDLLLRFNSGIPAEFAARGLATMIQKFWGAKFTPDAMSGFSEGLPLAMAIEVLEAMTDAGFLNQTRDKIRIRGEDPKDFIRFSTPEHETINTARKKANLIEQLVLADPEQVFYIGEPPKSPAKTQLRNGLVENTDEQRQALGKYEKHPHTINVPMLNFLEAIGDQLALSLFGPAEPNENTNKNHRKTIEGKRRTIQGALNAARNLVENVRDYAAQTSTELGNVPIHYRYNVSKVGRLHMLGSYNPQGSKVMRELSAGTWSKLTSQAHEDVYMLAIGQHLDDDAVGKVHKQPRAKTVANTVAALEGKFAPAVDVFRNWLNDGDMGPEQVAVLTQVLGPEASPAKVHALMDYARFLNHKGSGDNKAFETHMYIEADGVTDGPINAMFHMALGRDDKGVLTGEFTPHWIKMLEKGGLFLYGRKMSISDFVNAGPDENTRDLYEVTNGAFQKFRDELLKDAPQAVREQMYHLMNLMSELKLDVRFEGNDVIISRGIAKNPLTVTIYGSSANGITSKFLRAITQEIYAQISTNTFSDQALESLEKVTQRVVDRDGKKWGIFNRGKQSIRGQTSVNATLTPQMKEALRDNLARLLVDPLRDGISAVIGEVDPATKAMQKAIQVQSILFADLQAKLVDKKLSEKEAAEKAKPAGEQIWRISHGLTQAEHQEILDSLKKYQPFVSTGSQDFLIGGKERIKLDLSKESVSGTDGRFQIPHTMMGVGDAGVKAIPTMIISRDGQMIMNQALTPDAEMGLQTFDGFAFSITGAEKGSEQINRAVWRGWQQNPLAAVADSFGKFMDELTADFTPMSRISEATRLKMGRPLVGLKKAQETGPAGLYNEMEKLRAELDWMAKVQEARHWAIGQIKASVDHMATAESPFLNPLGEVLEGSYEQMSDRLNELVRQRLAEQGVTETKSPVLNVRPVARPISLEGPAVSDNVRLERLHQAFKNKIGRHLARFDPATRILKKDELGVNMAEALRVMKSFQFNGFRMNRQEMVAFRTMVAVMMTEIQLDPNALSRANDLWQHVTSQLKPSMFMQNPTNPTQEDVGRAQDKLGVLLGENYVATDDMGRSSLLSAFLALSMVNDELRNVLSNLKLPEVELSDERTLDAYLTNWGTKSMDTVDRILSGQQGNNVRQAIDSLIDVVATNDVDIEGPMMRASNAVGTAFDKANDILTTRAKELALKASNKLKQFRSTNQNKLLDKGAVYLDALTTLVDEDRADQMQTSVMSHMSRKGVRKLFLDTINEITGRTEDNAPIYDMIKRVRSIVQQTRQQFRERLPETIAGKFSRKLTAEEKSSMFFGMAKTDLAALADGFSISQILSLLADPSKVAPEILKLEEQVQNLAGNDWALVQAKAKELAIYMNTGELSTNQLLRNADAIAHLLGLKSTNKTAPTPAYIKAIDQLVSLYALQGIPKKTRETLQQLAENEKGGMAFTMTSLIGQSAGEREKRGGKTAQFNGYKGHVTTEQEQGLSLVVENDSDYADLIMKGYTRVGDYTGSAAEGAVARKGYYFAPISGRAPFHQGIFQNVRQMVSGVDPRTGFTMNRMVASRITDQRMVAKIKRRSSLAPGGEALMPIFDPTGEIVAYERAVDPRMEAKLNYNTDMTEVMGIWRGRQAEEYHAVLMNEGLVQALGQKWNDDQGSNRADEYVDLFSKQALKDPVLADAVRLITPEAREMIKDYFGETSFMVRRDMIDDAIGYRAVSLGDPWTGNTRMSETTQEVMRKVAMIIFKEDAYKYLVKGETVWKNFVSDARMTIVVKSGIVPVANILSNVAHLLMIGVPAGDIIRGAKGKVLEAEAHHRNQLKKIDLQNDLFNAKAENKLGEIRRIEAAIKSIDDADRRLSIWPLIEAGEFSSVTEAGVNHDDLLLSSGKLNAYFEKLADQLPDSVKTAGRYAIISQDTALFKGLQKSVQYGDFVAKAIMFDHLTKKKNRTKEYALGRITQEFINFDRLAGRGRTALENFGLLWFWHFKLRSMKIAISTIRDNPLQVFLSSLIPMPDFLSGIGTPVSDNMIGVAADGRLEYSVGPDQAFRAYQLLPAVNVLT